MAHGEILLSKVCDENAVKILDRYGVLREHFATEVERQAYDFIRKYANENGGKAPSYAALIEAVPDFVYVPDVTDSFEYLVRNLKHSAGKRQFAELVEKELPKMFSELDTDVLIDQLTKKLEDIKMGTSVRKTIGIDVVDDVDEFMSEYKARKKGKSFKIWKSKFPSINEAIGGYYSSNMYTWYGRSGRGKSVIVMEDAAIEAAFQGATVLVWALEMGWYEWLARAYSSISSRTGLMTADIDGVSMPAGFNANRLRTGRMTEEYEKLFEAFAEQVNEIVPGKIILRAIDHPDFFDKSLRQLESDIYETNADVVVIDPFYYLDYERNTSRTTGGDAAATSMKLRLLAGKTGTVIHVITQADEDKADKKGDRELNPPTRADIKKTTQLLEDAAASFGIDTVAEEGRGIIVIGKGRDGGEDKWAELIYLPKYGIVREVDPADEARKF